MGTFVGDVYNLQTNFQKRQDGLNYNAIREPNVSIVDPNATFSNLVDYNKIVIEGTAFRIDNVVVNRPRVNIKIGALYKEDEYDGE